MNSDYLAQYEFTWDLFDVFVNGQSSLDVYSFMGQLKTQEQVPSFLEGYGFDLDNPVSRAELFGYFQEAVQFIKRYLLKEGHPDGAPLELPPQLALLTDIDQLFLLTTSSGKNRREHLELALWAGVVLKVMHTFLHAEKDLRHRYFSTIQTQIFDRYYKYIHRDEGTGELFLGGPLAKYQVPLVEFQTKAKKSRESIVIKLLHKKENVAEELFDRVGMRLITKNVFDSLRVLKFLADHYIVVPQNVKPSRCLNSLVEMAPAKIQLQKLYELAKEEGWDEATFYHKAVDALKLLTKHQEPINVEAHNRYSLKNYRAMHFTCRQLIRYTNPFMREFTKVKNLAKEEKDQTWAQMILKLDTSTISRDLRFFYPYEVQITDAESHYQNTLGEASHREYKTLQTKAAAKRLFKPLLLLKQLEY